MVVNDAHAPIWERYMLYDKATVTCRCSFRVGIVVLLCGAVRTAVPKVGRVTLLSAWVKAFKPHHRGEAGRKPGLPIF